MIGWFALENQNHVENSSDKEQWTFKTHPTPVCLFGPAPIRFTPVIGPNWLLTLLHPQHQPIPWCQHTEYRNYRTVCAIGKWFQKAESLLS